MEKTFEWDLYKGNKTGLGFLKTNHKNQITEDTFVSFWATEVRSNSKEKYKAHKYSKSTCRARYNRLKKNFEFFTSNARAV